MQTIFEKITIVTERKFIHLIFSLINIHVDADIIKRTFYSLSDKVFLISFISQLLK